MKILICFIDMLREKESTEDKELKNFLKDIGGKYYTNAYTIATDTFRSFASICTSLYPNENGCKNSTNVPEVFINTDNTIFSFLINKNFKLYLKIRPTYSNISMFSNLKNSFYSNDLDIIISEYEHSNADNKVLFYYDEDYHDLIVKQSNKKQEKFARKQSLKNLKYLFHKINVEDFDKILIFSDHGCCLYEDEIEDFYTVRNNRSKIFLFLQENPKEKILKIENKLVSTLDIFPTIVSWFESEKKFNFEGINLNSKEKREIYIEDGFCDYLGYFLGRKELKKYYKIRIKNDVEDKTYYYNDVVNEKNFYFLEKISHKLVYCKTILQLNKIHKKLNLFSIENLNFKLNKEILNYYNNHEKIKKNHFYNNRSIIFNLKWKLRLLEIKIKKFLEVYSYD